MPPSFLEPCLGEIRDLCRQFNVARLDAFGSVVSSAHSERSDIDFVVEFVRDARTNAFAQYFGFKEALDRLLNRPIDLVCYNAIRNPFFKKEVDATKELVYGA